MEQGLADVGKPAEQSSRRIESVAVPGYASKLKDQRLLRLLIRSETSTHQSYHQSMGGSRKMP